MIVNEDSVNKEYICDEDERITITFTALNRDNVEIRRAFDGAPLKVVTGDSLSFTMGTTERRLKLSFKFATGNDAECTIDVEGENGGSDSMLAVDLAIPDIKKLIFVPAEDNEN